MAYLTRDQVRQIDRRAIQEIGIPGIILMENAARAVVAVAQEMLAGHRAAHVVVLAGGGNNGGDGLAVARHLHNLGHDVRIALCIDPARYSGDALTNWRIVQAMRLESFAATRENILNPRPDLYVDAIFGTGLTQPPRPPFGELADAVNTSGVPVLAVDLPSGMDCDTGRPLGACIRATRTVTFVALKAGFADPRSQPWTGALTVGDIGCPRELIGV
jgi:NAD(P)H-hydrate epimerase